MRFRAYTVSPDEFDRWVAGQQATAVAPAAPAAAAATGAAAAATPVAEQTPTPAPVAGYVFPAEELPSHVIPTTPIPEGLTFSDDVLSAGDARRGFEQYSRSLCIGCHRIRGNPSSLGVIGPDLTHVGSRHTIGAGLFPNDARHLALWIKNARKMKPMSLAAASMPTVGIGEFDPLFLKTSVTAALGGLTDQQIADIVAYLRSLK
jgi:cytochrome c oxidase subunit 2